jgi:hypothetical protein
MRRSVSAMRAYVAGLKARTDQRRLGYWDTLLAQYAVRAYPFDTVDPTAWLRAREHRDRMPAMPSPAARPRAAGVQGAGAGALAVGTSWRFVGPKNLIPTALKCFGPTAVSGNALCSAYHPSVPGTYWVGTAGGGLWKTVDFGENWTPLGDNWPALTVSSIAVHPTNPNTMLVGLGQWFAWQSHPSGVWRTTNGGSTWEDISPPDTAGHMVRSIVYDPGDPNTVIIAMSSLEDGPGRIFRSTNGGDSWTQKLTAVNARWVELRFALPDAGGTRRLFALGEKDSGHLYRSSDSGANWTPVTLPFSAGTGNHQNGLRMACSATNPSWIYAVSGRDKSVQRSSFLGAEGTWIDMTGPMATQFEGNWYQYTADLVIACSRDTTAATPTDVLYLGLVSLFQSPDGSSAWREFTFDFNDTKAHVDQHSVTFNPTDPNEMLFTNDGGIYRATYSPTASSWTVDSLNADLEITQFTHLAVHPTDVNCVLGGTQDNATPAWCGPTRKWLVQGTGDGSFGAISPTDPDVRYSGWINGGIQLTANGWDGPNPEITPDVGTDRLWQYTPFVVDPNDSTKLYYGTNYLWRFDRSGHSGTWTGRLGGVELTGPGAALLWIAVAPSDSATIYTGSTDGHVWVTTNAGANWRRIDVGAASLPDRAITCIAVHPTKPYQVIVTVGGNTSQHVWRCGDTRLASPFWQSIDGSPSGTAVLPMIHTEAVVYDPYDPDATYYVANDVGVFATMDGGSHWCNAGGPLGLPNAQPTGLAVASGSKNLFVSTYGRGIWRMQLQSTGILLTEPNGEAQYEQGATVDIRWVSKGKPGTTCDIWLRDTRGRLKRIGNDVPTADASFLWTIPLTETLRSGCRLEVVTDLGYSDISDADFDIIERTALDLTRPASGAVWVKGAQVTISWTYTGQPGPRVKVDLLRGGSFVRTIAANASRGTAGGMTYPWTVATDLTPRDDYQVRVTDLSDATHTDTGPYFEIVDATAIEVTEPTEDAVWHMDTTQQIRWRYSGSPGAMVRIWLYRDGASIRQIGPMMSIGSGGVGSYDWALPDDLTPGDGYTIRVGNEVVIGESAPFSIAAVRCRMRVDDAEGRIAYPINLRAVLTNWFTGDPLVGFPVHFRIYETAIGSATTNASGEARYTYTLPETWKPSGYALYADYVGDATHSPISGIAGLTITKGVAVAYVAPASGFATENIELRGSLRAQPNSAAIAGRVLRFTVDGSIVLEEPTGPSGAVVLPYRIPELAPGDYTIGVTFDGDDWYESASDTDVLTVRRCDTFLVPKPVSGQIGETVTLEASLTRQGDRFPMVGRELVFRVAGAVVGTADTDFEGVARVPYAIPVSLGVGGKTYQVEYAGEPSYVAHTQIGVLTVSKADTALTVPDTTSRPGQFFVARARLTRVSDGAPLEGKVVVFQRDGMNMGQDTTDADGWADMDGSTPDDPSAGVHTLGASFAGDVLHRTSTGQGTLTVEKADTTLWTISRSGTVTEVVTLRQYDLKRTTDNRLLEGREITFRMDGTAVGTATTNAGGDSTLSWTITPGAATRTITVEYAGANVYNPASASATMTCQTWTTKMVEFNRTARIAAVTEFKALLLRSDDRPLYNKGIRFSVDGTFVIERPTNTQGYASYPYYHVPDGAGAGTRPILSEWPGDAGYGPISKTAVLTVQRAMPYIWVLPRTIPQGGVARLYAYFRRLPDYQKQEGKMVTFRVDGTWIADVTTLTGVDGGIARYTYTSVEAPGAHTIRCEFAGDSFVDAGYGEAPLTIF